MHPMMILEDWRGAWPELTEHFDRRLAGIVAAELWNAAFGWLEPAPLYNYGVSR